MIYFIEDAKDGGLVAVTESYEDALNLQDQLWENKDIDTHIR